MRAAGEYWVKGVTGRLGSVKTFQSLSYPDYRLLWLSIICTGVAFSMEQVALGWYVYQSTDSPWLVGAVQGVRTLPFLLAAPLGGVLADRLERQRLMVLSAGITAVFALVLGVLIVSGAARLWSVFLLTSLTGMAFSFSIPVRQSLIPRLVERKHLMNAVALQSTGFQLTNVAAPAVAGLLLHFFSAGAVFLANAALYSLVALIVLRIRAPANDGAARRESMLSNLQQGFLYVAKEPTIRTLLLLGFFPVVFGWPVITLMPIFARDVFHIGPAGLGYMNAAAGVGAVLATVVLASLGNYRGRGWLLMWSCLLLGVAVVLFALTPGWPAALALALLCLLAVGAGRMAFMTLMNTVIQVSVPDHLLGRVMSLVAMNFGMTTIGSLLAGAIASAVNATAAVLMLGALVVAAGLYALLFLRGLRSV